MKPACNVATLIERFFTERLIRQRNVSANTIASYRDTFRLLFMFAQVRLRKSPSALTLADLDATFIGAFLTDLEVKRGASAKTRNLRLTAIRSFFRFVSFEEPAHSALIQRVLAIPSKRHDKRQVHFLTRPEIEAVLAAPDQTTWLGRRDHTLLLVAAQTGFLDGPRVLANMALDRWFPTKFAALSDRLVTQKGILIMGVSALAMMVITKGSVMFLVVLYSINVFITFCLSQLGMVRHWYAGRGPGFRRGPGRSFAGGFSRRSSSPSPRTISISATVSSS